jgi:hypothetical protein
LVESNQFVAIAPRGYDNCWQLGPENSDATVEEETAFIDTLVAGLSATEGLDAERPLFGLLVSDLLRYSTEYDGDNL